MAIIASELFYKISYEKNIYYLWMDNIYVCSVYIMCFST